MPYSPALDGLRAGAAVSWPRLGCGADLPGRPGAGVWYGTVKDAPCLVTGHRRALLPALAAGLAWSAGSEKSAYCADSAAHKRSAGGTVANGGFAVLDASSGEAYYRFDMRISGLLLGACLGKWIGGYRRTYCDGTG